MGTPEQTLSNDTDTLRGIWIGWPSFVRYMDLIANGDEARYVPTCADHYRRYGHGRPVTHAQWIANEDDWNEFEDWADGTLVL